ncbi:hypothetical protein HQ314_04640 [Rhodococcus sp. BP-332]|uniref:dimethylamine monooxygenase subunit DmmA family protein n=1 Tax=Rhodococcus sp. BP-332 TaxID=2739447 RepID=UPI001C9AD5B3|nr:dimethylamine monooxygenase subunit DmmA family protein [Rhodococcus sp. BP-332]MBY6676206.1 hypothetical protein [Rhodococcus sp. BP-332]
MTVLIIGDADRLDSAGESPGRFAVRGPESDAWFDAETDRAVVGWRCVLIGSAAHVAVYRERALRAGAEPDEISVVVTQDGSVDVYCPVCGTVGPAPPCGSCGANLVVTDHVSSRLAARLGVPDAAS